MKDLVKHKIAKEIYANGKVFLWGCLVSLLALCIGIICYWLERWDYSFLELWYMLFWVPPFFAIIIRYMVIAYKWVIKWK